MQYAHSGPNPSPVNIVERPSNIITMDKGPTIFVASLVLFEYAETTETIATINSSEVKITTSIIE